MHNCYYRILQATYSLGIVYKSIIYLLLVLFYTIQLLSKSLFFISLLGIMQRTFHFIPKKHL